MTDEEFFTILFPTTEEYPENLAERGVPLGTFYDYVSCSFLDGFINYVNIFGMYVLAPSTGRLEEYETALKETSSMGHTKFHDFGLLDVILLAETKNSYWVFWYDPDVSDCGIGRCLKEISRELFAQVCVSVVIGSREYKKLDWLPKGWVEW